MSTMNFPSSRRARIAPRQLLTATLVAALVAALGNLIIFGIGTALGISFVFPMGPAGSPAQPLSAVMVIAATVVPAFAAVALLAGLSFIVARPLLVFQLIAVIFALLSLGGPAALPVALATKLALGSMHLVAAAAIVGSLSRAARER